MRVKGGKKVKERSVRLTPETMDSADSIAEESYSTFNGLVEMLVDAAIAYREAEGAFKTPLRIVSKADYEAFKAWEAERQRIEQVSLKAGLVQADYRRVKPEKEDPKKDQETA